MGTREDGDFIIIRKLGHKRRGRFGVRYLVLMVPGKREMFRENSCKNKLRKTIESVAEY